MEPTASSQQAVHVTGPHLTVEEMVQAGLVPKQDHVWQQLQLDQLCTNQSKGYLGIGYLKSAL